MRGISTSRVDLGPVLETGREVALDGPVHLPDFETFRFPEPAVVSLRIRRVGGFAEIEGTIDAVASGTCVRCLEDATLPLHLDVLERLDPSPAARDPLDEGNVLDGTHLDVGDLVRQLIDSALPLALTCSSTCPGLCDRCGHRGDVCRCSPSNTETTWRT